MNRASISGVGLALGLVLLSPPAGSRTLQLEDYLDLERVSNPQISPDGRAVLYTRSRVDTHEDRFVSELWVMDANGDRNRRLADGGGEIRWSPDGGRIAYIGPTAHGPQIFVRWMDAQGGIGQVTHGTMAPSGLSWSPDGKWIAFMAHVPAPPRWTIELPERPEGAHWTGDPVVIDKLHYRLDGAGLLPSGHSHIFIVSAAGGAPRQLTHGDWHAEPRIAGMPYYRGALEWTPDGRSILFSADREPDSDTRYAQARVHAVDVADGRIRTITGADGFWGMAPGPRISPDGKRVAYLGMQASGASNYPDQELRVIGVDGRGERTLIGDLPGRVGHLQWAGDGRGLYLEVDQEGASNIRFVALSGESRPVTSGAQTIAWSSTSAGGVAVGTLASAYRPPEVVRFDLKDGRGLRLLTAVNDDVLGDIRLGRVEEIWYGSTDGARIQGWIVYPPDFDPGKRYPLVLDIHGGPENMFAGHFYFSQQDFAAHGYVVLYTNPRGSTGYGGAFARAIYDAWPGRVDYEDLMHGVDAVVGRGFIDETRMYVQGCSGGGTLTAWAVTRTDRFAGAAALCPIVNMISQAGSADNPGWVFNRYRKPFWEDPASWLATSSILRMNRVTTPTLVMVGEKDIRTPVAQSQELYTALKMAGVPTRLILFRDEWHGTRGRPSNMLRTQLYLRKWFGEWRRAHDGASVHEDSAS